MLTAVADPGVKELTQGNHGFIGRIPVRNLWLLMLYASDFRKSHRTETSTEENPDEIAGLVARVLCDLVEHRLSRNLSHGYITQSRVMNRVRGRILALQTERHQLLLRGQVACQFEELTVDTRRNRFVRLALEHLAPLVRHTRWNESRERASPEHRCRELSRRLAELGVKSWTSVRPTQYDERLGINDRQDRPMIGAAELAMNMALLTEEAGERSLFAPDREEYWIRTLFEKAVVGMFRQWLDEHEWTVRAGEGRDWPVTRESAGIHSLLPRMVWDMRLEHAATGRRIIIDTKFAEILVANRHGGLKLKSGYFYQMYAYLRSQEGQGDALADSAEGILLHPAIGETDTGSGSGPKAAMLNEWADIQGHRMRFATVDLTASAAEIRKQLLEVTGLSP